MDKNKFFNSAAVAAILIGAASAHAAELKDHQEWSLLTAGFSRHSTQPSSGIHRWRDFHPGIGIEAKESEGLDTDWRRSLAAGAMQDSRGGWGGHASISAMKTLYSSAAIRVDAGAGLYAFYRSMNWRGKMGFVPAILPVMSITNPEYRIGLNLLVVPPVGRKGDRPAVLFAQISYRLN